MNTKLEAIADKIADNITAKAIATPDPGKITATDQAEILTDILKAIDPLIVESAPWSPEGIGWFSAPTVEIVGNNLNVSESDVNIEGVIQHLNAAVLPLTLPPANFQTPYTVVADPNAETGAYELIPGDTVAENASFAFPPVPAQRLWVANFMFTNMGVVQAPGGVVKAISVNEGPNVYPNASGILSLSVYGSDNTKLPIATPETTGTVLTFTTDTVYGSEATPVTSNITANITGALLGVTNLIIHNSGTAPTFDNKFHKLSGSGDYVLGVKNYIFCQYLSATRINYTISQ